jgi:polyisoprenoid-binding protein YceI
VTRRGKILLIVGFFALAGAAGAYIAYDQFLRGDNVAPIGLPTASLSASKGSPGTTTGPAGPSPTPLPAASLPGTWSVAGGSLAGYRVREQLASLPAESDAVGRTTAITGAATLAAAGDSVSVTAASFEADLTALQSDEDRRDRRIREIGLESTRFPTATFVLAAPVAVSAAALSGAAADVTLVGDLTIHGVTKRVEILAQAQLAGDRIEVAGSLTFPFADFAIEPPNIGGFVTVQPDATLEFLLILAHD